MSSEPKKKKMRKEAEPAEPQAVEVGRVPRMPEEVLLMIFAYLPKRDLLQGVAPVCRRWSELVMDSSLWKEVRMGGLQMTVERAKKLLEHMKQLKSVRLLEWMEDSQSDEVLIHIAELFPNLESLDIDYCNIWYCDTLERVASRCQNIKELRLHLSRLDENTRHVFDIFANSAKLEKLSLNRCEFNWTGPDSSLRKNWPRLRDVTLNHFSSNTDFELELVCRDAPALQKLVVYGLVHPESLLHLNRCVLLEELTVPLQRDVSCLKEGVSSLRNIRRLNLEIRISATVEFVSFFSAKEVVQKLESLEIRGICYLGDHCLPAVGSNCPQLTRISFQGVLFDEDGLVALLTGCDKLKLLEMYSSTCAGGKCIDFTGFVHSISPEVIVKI